MDEQSSRSGQRTILACFQQQRAREQGTIEYSLERAQAAIDAAMALREEAESEDERAS